MRKINIKLKNKRKIKIESFGYILLREYIKNNERRVIIKDKYNYRYDVHFSTIGKNNPPVAHVNNPYSLKNISMWLNLNSKLFELTKNNKYIKSKNQLNFYCHVCKDYFVSSWNDISSHKGCGVCGGMQVGKYHSVGYLRPKLLEEFDKSNTHSLFDITVNSDKIIKWKCKDCGERWKTPIKNRSRLNYGCPFCSGNRVSDNNRLSILYPEISKEWDYKKNKNISPHDVSYGSEKIFYWICQNCNNNYKKSVDKRTLQGIGCLKCSSPKGEKEIQKWVDKNRRQLKKVGVTEIKPQKTFPDCKDKNKLLFDFGLQLKNKKWILVEYHGGQHYFPVDFAGKGTLWAEEQFKKNKRRDRIKKKYCKKNGIKLIIIPYTKFNKIEKILNKELL